LANILEVGDLTRKRKKSTNKYSTRWPICLPPFLIPFFSTHRQSELSNILGARSAATPIPAENGDSSTVFAEFGQARDRVLGLKVDQIKDSVSGSSVADPRGYLTDLSSFAIKVFVSLEF
jgi:pre-mRNA-processing factor 6